MTTESQIIRPFVAIFLAVLLQLNLAPTLAARVDLPKQSNTGYELVQFDLESDRTIVQISRFGLRIENKRGSTVIISTPPKWDVTVFSTKTKRMCRTELKNFTGEYRLFFTMFVQSAYADEQFEKKGTSTNNGLKLDCYQTLPAYKLEQFENLRKHLIRATAPMELEYCSCTSLPSAPAIEFIMQSLHGMPKVPGIPIHLAYRSLEGQKELALDTLSYRPKQFSIDNYKIPAGLENVKNVSSIRADKSSVQRAADFVDGVRILKMR